MAKGELSQPQRGPGVALVLLCSKTRPPTPSLPRHRYAGSSGPPVPLTQAARSLTLSPDLELGVPSSNESPPFSPRSMASSDSDDGQREEEAGTKPAPAQLTLGPMWQRLISAAERGRRHEQTQLTPSLALAYGTAALAGSACMFTGVTLYRGVRRERRGDERAVDATARLAATPAAARALATASAATIAVAGVAILAMRACGLRTTQDVANAGRAIVTGEPKA